MQKRRKRTEIYKEMDRINKRKPTSKEIDELAKVLIECGIAIDQPKSGKRKQL